jgi:hypothetical protein
MKQGGFHMGHRFFKTKEMFCNLLGRYEGTSVIFLSQIHRTLQVAVAVQLGSWGYLSNQYSYLGS